MKKKNIFIVLSLAISMLLGLTACSNDEDVSSNNTIVKMEDGSYVMNIDFDCEAPVYDAGTTRAVTYNWGTGTTIFARVKSGSSYLKAQVVHISGTNWRLRWWGELAMTTTPVSCELIYLQESNGDYYVANEDTKCFDIYNNDTKVKATNIPWNTETIDMSEATAVYGTTEATYTYTSSGFTMKATLKPLMWRLRFKGTNGTSITLPANGNDITYCNKLTWKADQALSCSKATKDVTLKVSSSYTPYIYGEFTYSYAKNTITVVNGSNTFYREFSSSNLPAGKSGYFTIPTTSNYSNNGWTMKQDVDPNATIAPNLLVPFEEGWASNWTVGSTAAKVLVITFSETGYTGKSDEELINAMEKYDPEEISQYENKVRCGYNTSSSFYSPNKQYYLCTVAYNSSGQRGPLIKTPFKTRAANLPYAEITDLRRTSEAQWKWKVSLKNNAKSYYLNAWNGSDRFSSHAYILAWLVYRDAINGKISAESEEGEWKWDINDTYMTVCTWGVASDGSFGNYRCSSAASSVYAPYQISTYEPKISNVKNNNMTCCPVSNVVLEETMDKINIIKIEE